MIFVKGPLETLNYFTDCMTAGLPEDSHFIFDICEPDINGLLGFIKQKRPQKVITFNNMAINFSLQDGRNFWELCHLTVFDYLVDHPINYLPELCNVPDCIIAITVDRNHKQFLETYCPSIRTLFLPHGGIIYDASPKTFSQRQIDVLYTGDNQEILTTLPIISELPENGRQLYLYTYQQFMTNPTCTTEAAVEKYFIENNLQPSQELLLTCQEYIHCSTERNARYNYKTQIMTQIAKSGIAMEIYGNNWDFLSTYDNVHIHPRVSSEECIRLMTDAKIVLNFMPWFKDGSHERIYNSMLNGAVCLTDPSLFIEETYRDLDTITYFHLDNAREASDKVKLLLSKPDVWEGISQRARTISQNDTWEYRRISLLSPRFIFRQSRELLLGKIP